jgi:hypothetical protein
MDQTTTRPNLGSTANKLITSFDDAELTAIMASAKEFSPERRSQFLEQVVTMVALVDDFVPQLSGSYAWNTTRSDLGVVRRIALQIPRRYNCVG